MRTQFKSRPCAGRSVPDAAHSEIQTVGRRRALLAAIALLLAIPACAQQKPDDLTNKSIEDLMNMEVTSASRKEQKLSSVPAAIFVITQQDIRDSGATKIPDLLRMVPGLDVAQINANTWAISARGFNLQFANKLLVLVDGRSVYTPLFGGVNWDTLDIPLEDIDRIEVICGPGGTIWGDNAVNGVINIMTKSAADTKGGLVVAGDGTEPQGFGTLQYGGKILGETSYRAFVKFLNTGGFPSLSGQDGNDDYHLLHGGFRADSTLSQKDSLTTQGDIYTGQEGATITHSSFTPPENVNVQRLADLSGGNILERWTHTFSTRCDTSLQFYFDNYKRDGPESNEARNTVDFDFQNHIALGARNDLIWGAGYRYTEDHTVGTIDQSFVPADFSGSLFELFLQDEITLKPDRLSLYVGSKLENGYLSGYDFDPSVRLAWTPTNRRTVWASISRASRTPSRRDTGLDATLAALPGPTQVALFGNPDFQSEHVIAYEAGYRAQASRNFSFDAALFFNDYSSLESVESLPPYFDPDFNPPLTVVPMSFANKLYGTTEGVELFGTWKVTSRWTLSPGFSFLEMHLHTQANSLDTTSIADAQGSNPGQQAQLRSHVDLAKNLAWDTNAYYVGRLPAQFVASYTRLDSLLTWRPRERIEFSVVGQNLLSDHHVEFNDQLQSVLSSQVKRSAYAKFTWYF